MQRIVTVLDTALTVNYNDRPISTQKDLDTYKFQFDDSWLGYVKTAVFYTDPAMVKHLLIPEDGVVTIPWEILTGKPQVLYIGVFGAKDSIIKPTTFGAVRLREGSYIDGIAPLPPTPDVYQQIISAWEGAKTEEEARVVNENSRRNNFDALVIEYNALKAELEQQITDGTASVDALQVLEADYAAKALALETIYAPRLGSVESQLAEKASQLDYVNPTIVDDIPFLGTYILGGGGKNLNRIGVNPIDPLDFESSGANNGTRNTIIGKDAGTAMTTGNGNTYIGYGAGAYTINGDQNTYIGWLAGYQNIDGYHNTFIGPGAGQNAQHGYFNTFVGCDSGLNFQGGTGNTMLGTSSTMGTGTHNVILGCNAGHDESTGSENVLIGYGIANNLTSGYSDVVIGVGAGLGLTTGSENTFIGNVAGNAMQTGSGNCAVGNKTLIVATGSSNSAFGSMALTKLLGGTPNEAFGYQTLYNLTTGYHNTAFGYRAGNGLTTGLHNTFLGNTADTTLNNIDNGTAVGFGASVAASNTMQLGNANVTKVYSHGDFETQDIGDGFICKSPDGTRYKITVANGGAIAVALA